jgi:hypothetical protein
LISDISACSGFTAQGDLVDVDALLGSLRDNGGPTKTMALLPGSPAIDAADDAVCAAPPVNEIDQRGEPRPAGPHCDMGSFEVQSTLSLEVGTAKGDSSPVRWVFQEGGAEDR